MPKVVIRVVAQRASVTSKRSTKFQIASDVRLYFRNPIASVRTAQQPGPPTLPVPPVPEVSVAEDRDAILEEDDVRRAR